MSYVSQIEWTDTTWNPVRGCSKISPGCKNCYAAVFAERWRGIHEHPYEFGFDLRLVPEKLLDPLTWTRPRKVFVNSMSDLFQDGVPDEFVLDSFRAMQAADWHIYQVLTKRSKRMKELVRSRLPSLVNLKHIWLGVSVEDRRHGVPRIEHLRTTPAAIRFLSIEPLLEDLGQIDLAGIHWVIVGGESGNGARPMKQSWVNSILRQCREKGVPFFFKQWGGVQKKKAGRVLNGKTYDEYPIVDPAPTPTSAERSRRLTIAQSQYREYTQIAGERTLQRA